MLLKISMWRLHDCLWLQVHSWTSKIGNFSGERDFDLVLTFLQLREGCSPLHFAARRNSLESEIVKLLVGAGANLQKTNK